MYDQRSRLLEGSLSLPNNTGRRFDISAWTLDVGYRLPARFGVRVRAPVLWKRFHENGASDRIIFGLGDVEFGATYDVLASPRWAFTTGLGLALPTGETNEQPDAGAEVRTLLQLGTGTVDPLIWAALAFLPIRNFDIHLALGARPVLYSNRFEYQAASVYTGALGVSHRCCFGERVGLGVEFEASHTTRARVRGSDLQDTGRDIVSAVPRIRVNIMKSLYAELAGSLPLYQNVNEHQLGSTFQVDLRVGYTSPPLVGAATPRPVPSDVTAP